MKIVVQKRNLRFIYAIRNMSIKTIVQNNENFFTIYVEKRIDLCYDKIKF